MKLLLDTCAILWIAADSNRLSANAKAHIASNSTRLYVSAISAFEIGLKHRKHKLDLGMAPEIWWNRAVAHHGLIVLPVTDRFASASTELPALHADPCDRIIIATATTIKANIITSDEHISNYPQASVIW